MIEKKVKPTTKTMAPAKAGSAVASKPNTAKAKVTTTAKPLMEKTAMKKSMAKPTLEERYRMLETAAYFIAEQHCFQGRSDEHWAAAERQLGL